MAYRPQPYGDTDSADTMLLDARRAALIVPLRAELRRLTREDKGTREISVDDAAFRLAVALDL